MKNNLRSCHRGRLKDNTEYELFVKLKWRNSGRQSLFEVQPSHLDRLSVGTLKVIE